MQQRLRSINSNVNSSNNNGSSVVSSSSEVGSRGRLQPVTVNSANSNPCAAAVSAPSAANDNGDASCGGAGVGEMGTNASSPSMMSPHSLHSTVAVAAAPANGVAPLVGAHTPPHLLLPPPPPHTRTDQKHPGTDVAAPAPTLVPLHL